MTWLRPSDLRLEARSLCAERRWAKGIAKRRTGSAFGDLNGNDCSRHTTISPLINGVPTPGTRWALKPITAVISAAASGLRSLGERVAESSALKLIFGWGALTATGAAFAAIGVATYAYVNYDDKFWLTRIDEVTVSPVFGANGALIGVIDTSGKLGPKEAADRAYIPLRGNIPQTYAAALLLLENRHFHSEGIHNICGLDLPSTVARIITLKGGGSTISMQLTKQLLHNGGESNIFTKGWRKLEELGGSCRLYQTLEKQGGRDALLRLYASYAPVIQGNGTTRGVEAGGRVLWDIAPSDLSEAKQLVLAAAVKKPIALLKNGDLGPSCKSVWPKNENLEYNPDLAKRHPSRQIQCQVTARAKLAAWATIPTDRLDAVIAELDGFERNGIHPVNPFEPIPAKKLINLSRRTAAALQPGVLNRIKAEAEENNFRPGEALVVSLDAVKQHQFALDMRKTLDSIQRSPAGRRVLCMPLVKVVDGERSLAIRPCTKDGADDAVADVLGIKINAKSGSIKAIFASTPLLMNATMSLGSVSKLIILVGAIADGYTEMTLVCPRAASDNGRPLKRVTAPIYGFQNCDRNRNTLTLKQAIARSDNLAFYDVARQLGATKLAAAANALGLGDPGKSNNMSYELAFGTYGSSPTELLGAMQALVAMAYDLNTTGTAPRILQNAEAEQNPAIAALRKAIPNDSQRRTLRVLLEAPVASERGTLGFVRSDVTAGKTGTTQSLVKSGSGHSFAHAKWAVTYQSDTDDINLFLVSSPLPSKPLAQHYITGSALAPAHRILLTYSL